MLRIAAIAGTRPEAIKLAPLIRRLRRNGDIDLTVVATGQHSALFMDALAEFGLSADIDLAVPNDVPATFCERVTAAMPALLDRVRPDLVIVQGDTASAWAAARAAHAEGVPIAHVEAGLRSHDPLLPWPEERNRREIDAISTLLFAPSAGAAANLQDAGGRIHVTGNTGIDALVAARPATAPVLRETNARLILVTCHRREAIPHLPALIAALHTLAERPDVRIRLPLHPNPALAALLEGLAGHPRIVVEPAIGYAAMLALLGQAHLLLTDSGGLQEEAPAFGLPTLVLRDVTERPEPVAAGNARLVGLDPARIVAETTRLLDDARAYAAMSRPAFPYGAGDASEKIARAITDWWSTCQPQ